MVVCKFYQQGNCRFGDNCRNEHPGARRGGFASQNRFGVFQSPANRTSGSSDARKDVPWSINTVDIEADLTDGKGRPKWILSTYGPGRGAPASLLEGSEYSFEELRARYYELADNDNQAQADEEAGALWSRAEAAMLKVANNAAKVLEFMEEAEKKHPNRFDFCKFDGTKPIDQFIKEAESNNIAESSGFRQDSFGQTSNITGGFGKPTSTFGQPAAPPGFGSGRFGQPSHPAAFGQSSSPFAQASASAFGKPAFGSTGFRQSPFGQPAEPALTFGQPSQSSAFGKPSLAASTFGQPSLPSAFGQASQPTSNFGKPSQPASGFGQPPQPLAFATNGFGQPSSPSAGHAFVGPPATSAFGQLSRPTSVFGQPSQSNSTFGKEEPAAAFGQPAQPTNFSRGSTFGQTLQPSTTSPFGATTASALSLGQPVNPQVANPFGKPASSSSRFDQQSQPTSTTGFGQPPQLATTSIGFGQPTATEPSSINPFGNGNTAGGRSSSSSVHPLTNKPPAALHYTETIPPGNTRINPQSRRLELYKGRRVQYSDKLHSDSEDKSEAPWPCYERPDGRGWERVWFPQADKERDVVNLSKEGKVGDLVPQEEGIYNDDVIEEYRYLFENGKWKDGKMARVPPMREWCAYEF